MLRCVIDWYCFYLNHSDGIRLENTTREVCYWKGLIMKENMYIKTSKKCQQFKNIKTFYEHLQPKTIAELKTWHLVYTNLIGPYDKSIIQYQPGGAIYRSYSVISLFTPW